jgi:hypothetical protein
MYGNSTNISGMENDSDGWIFPDWVTPGLIGGCVTAAVVVVSAIAWRCINGQWTCRKNAVEQEGTEMRNNPPRGNALTIMGADSAAAPLLPPTAGPTPAEE